MNIYEAIALVDGEAPPVILNLYARRTSRGTLIYGCTPGYALPEGIDDAEVVLASNAIVFHKDRTKAFNGHSYMTILSDGTSIALRAKLAEVKERFADSKENKESKTTT